MRLAWHSSGTYDRISKTGGSGQGTIRFKEELAHGGNAGLVNAVGWLEPLKKKHPGVSYADLYTYAGVVSVEARLPAPWPGAAVERRHGVRALTHNCCLDFSAGDGRAGRAVPLRPRRRDGPLRGHPGRAPARGRQGQPDGHRQGSPRRFLPHG